MINKSNILLAFYGDDFTGSTDALEFISRAGSKTILFIDPPTEAQLRSFKGIQAYGVAGKTRSLSPAAMEEVLLPAFKQMKQTGARHIHYKTCSTFDSSPTIGSIGRAIDCGATVFDNTITPVIGGMPALGRYCVFGNLFAQMGIGSKGKIYRLDRHPSMSKHPVTPANESDLCIHLSRQTTKRIGLIDILQVARGAKEMDKAVAKLINVKCQVALIDALTDDDLLVIGEWLDGFSQANEQTRFSVGSSGIEMALGKYWNEKGLLKPIASWPAPARTDSLLVVSGSCSPVSATQIAWAKANGFAELELDAVKICNDDVSGESIFQNVSELLQRNKNLIVHTGSKQQQPLSSEKLGAMLGCIARRAVKASGVTRVVVAGGDTSSYAARSMEIDAVEMIAPVVAGAPLCKTYSRNKSIDELEVNFKGGQVGAENYYGLLTANG